MICQSEFRFLLLAFLLINLFLPQAGNPNPGSRLAMMAAMTEYHSMQISPYVETAFPWTNDWSRTPDGAYYTNKPPLPQLLGYPLFFFLDRFVVSGAADVETRNSRRRSALPFYNKWLSFLLQALPFAWIAGLLGGTLRKKGFSLAQTRWALLAILFGNTAIHYMNTYFGHGMAALFILGAVYALAEERWGWSSLLFGLAGLTDYASLLLLISCGLVFFVVYKPTREQIFAWGIGLIGPLLVLGIYNQLCFGGPLHLGLQFQNPEFISPSQNKAAILGTIQIGLHLPVMWQLLFGSSRGLLVTQPWIFWSLAGCFLILLKRFPSKNTDPWFQFVHLFGIFGFFLLLGLNISFNGWHGGQVVGPRYLSCIIPVLAISLGTSSPSWLAKVAIILSVLYTGLVFSTTLYAPLTPLWPYLIHVFLTHFPNSFYRLCFYLLAVGIAWVKLTSNSEAPSNGSECSR